MKTILTKLTQWMSKPERGFSAASERESFIYGARRPGFPFTRVGQDQVQTWITFMQGQGITRVVCLLPPRQLQAYDDIINQYRHVFGEDNVLWSPIDDFQLAREDQLIEQILPFLATSDQQKEKAVVHCSGGIGRTGHVLAAWLASHRGMSNEEAIEAVKRQGRNAREARNKHLDTLLNQARIAFSHR
jgi:protein-tyrosine phosphatase